MYDVVRSTVPKIDLDDVFVTKEEISAEISTALKQVIGYSARKASLPLPSRLDSLLLVVDPLSPSPHTLRACHVPLPFPCPCPLHPLSSQHMADFGYEILATPITDIEPNGEVKRAMNEINRAKRMREAAKDSGEAVKIKAIKEAEAEANRTEIQAKASAGLRTSRAWVSLANVEASWRACANL